MSSKEIETAVGTLFPLLMQYGFPINDMTNEQLGKILFEKNRDKLNLLKYGLSKLDKDIESFLDRSSNLERGITKILQDLIFVPQGCEDKFITGECSIKEQVTVWKKLFYTLELLSSTDDSISETEIDSIFTEALNTLTDKNSGSEVEQLVKTIQAELDANDDDDDDDDEINNLLPVSNTVNIEADQPEDHSNSVLQIDEIINNCSSDIKSAIGLLQSVKKAKIQNKEELCSAVHNFHESLSRLEKNNTVNIEGGQPVVIYSVSHIAEVINNFSSMIKSEIGLLQSVRKANLQNREEFCSAVYTIHESLSRLKKVTCTFLESLSRLKKLLEDLNTCME